MRVSSLRGKGQCSPFTLAVTFARLFPKGRARDEQPVPAPLWIRVTKDVEVGTVPIGRGFKEGSSEPQQAQGPPPSLPQTVPGEEGWAPTVEQVARSLVPEGGNTCLPK